MPIYEYRCNACGHEFEVMQKITDGPIRKCEKCGRLKAKRQISQTSFILKGSGWYVTDYKGKKPSDNGKHATSQEEADKASTDSKDKSKNKKKTKDPKAKSIESKPSKEASA